MEKLSFNIVQTDWGIGDIICSLYGVQALALKYPESDITLYMRNQFQWVALADIRRLSMLRYKKWLRIPNAVFLHQPQDDKHLNSPKKLYASKLMVEPVKPALKPELLKMEPVFKDKYVVLAPFASHNNRTWALNNWKVLAQQITALGYRVIVIDGHFNKERCKQIGVEYYCGMNAVWIANVCRHAAMLIGNDSGMAHLGGWIGTKTLVIMSQLLPEQFYDMTENRFIIPKQECTGCRFNHSLGYVDKCNSECWVLQTATPEDVLNKAIEWLQEEKQPNLAYA